MSAADRQHIKYKACSFVATSLPQSLTDTSYSWAKCHSGSLRQKYETERSQEALKLLNSSCTLTGSASGETCGQALAGSLSPRGTARDPTIVHISRDGEKTETQIKQERSVPSGITSSISVQVSTAGFFLYTLTSFL